MQRLLNYLFQEDLGQAVAVYLEGLGAHRHGRLSPRGMRGGCPRAQAAARSRPTVSTDLADCCRSASFSSTGRHQLSAADSMLVALAACAYHTHKL